MQGSYQPLQRCRLSGSQNLLPVLHLGRQELTGVCPRTRDEPVTSGPLDLVWCPDSGLLQLAASCDPGEMCGENYGYRSGLNQSMVPHLTRKIQNLEKLVDLQSSDTGLDIGSKGATALKAYQTQGLKSIGIDPTAFKFKDFSPDDSKLIFLVPLWHFKEGIVNDEQEFICSGGKFIFPFPEIEII